MKSLESLEHYIDQSKGKSFNMNRLIIKKWQDIASYC